MKANSARIQKKKRTTDGVKRARAGRDISALADTRLLSVASGMSYPQPPVCHITNLGAHPEAT